MAIDAVGLVQATKGNIRAFCTMAERFMECLKTKTRGCFGEDVRHRLIFKKNVFREKKMIFQFVRGSLSELIELSQKCCVNINERMSEECPFVGKKNFYFNSNLNIVLFLKQNHNVFQ